MIIGTEKKKRYMSMIEIKGLSKTYRNDAVRVDALKEVNLKIEKGDYIAVMGASGSGKSTLLHILGAMDRMTSGEYFFEGAAVHKMNANELHRFRAEHIGFVFQDFALMDYYTVAENVSMPLLCRKIPQKECNERVNAVIDELGIRDVKDKRINHISGGQKARAAIARAIVTDAQLILADEPTGSLDSATGEEIMGVLDAMNREGRTILLVTHDEKVAKHADRLLYVKDGKVFGDKEE